MRLNYTLVVTLCCCLLSPILHFAQTTWDGSESTDWFDANNWSDGLPAINNNAIIDNPSLANLPIINQPLTIDFTITNAATLQNNTQIIIDATATIINMPNGVFINDGQVINSGEINHQGDWQNNQELINQSLFNSNGTITNALNANLVNTSRFTNDGVVTNLGTLLNQAEWQDLQHCNNNGLIVNQGSYHTSANSIFTNGSGDGAGQINNLGNFTISGSVTNNVGVFNNMANLAIGNSGRFINNAEVINDELMSNSGAFTNNATFHNTKNFFNENGNSNFTNNAIAINQNCAILTQRSNLIIQNIENNGIVDKINGADVTTVAASTGIVLCEAEDTAVPTVRCVADFSTTLGANGELVIEPSDIDDGSTATYCAIATYDVSPNTFTCADYGEQELTLTVTDEHGGQASCTTTILIEGNPMNNGIACNNNVIVSIPNHCEPTEITYDIVLEGGYDCEANFEVMIQGRPTPFITGDDVGKTLRVNITDPNSTSNCWGNIIIEDKTAPIFVTCPDVTLFCIDNPAPVSEGGKVPDPIVKDCIGLTLNYYDDMNSEDCGYNLISSIERTWVAIGANGMRSECTQIIEIENISFQKYPVQCPENIQIACNVNGTEANIDPSITGYPFVEINGIPVELIHDDVPLCGISATYRDAIFTDVCGAGKKIYRSWIAAEWCNASTVFTCQQIIEIVDTQAPVIQLRDNIAADATSAQCGASINLPAADITDCSDVTVQIETAAGTINNNGGQIPAPGLPIGENTVTYIATDDCGNQSSRTLTISIADNTPPVAVCAESISISLNDDGFAQLFPESIEAGSKDNCGIEKYEVFRMDSPCVSQEIPGPFTTFSCCDIANTPIMVALRVTDFAGNYNDCMIEVFVEDKIQPQVICPPDKVISCDADLDDLSVTGQAYGTDNCDNLTITYRDEEIFNSCGIGTVLRTWSATSPRGEQITCVQTIEIYNPEPFDGAEDITWPADVTRNNCIEDSDPEFTGEPIFRSSGCNQIYATYKDEVFPQSDDACLKILREWRVLDWCPYGTPDTSEWFYYQTIRFVDDNAPVFPNCNDIEICNPTEACEGVADLTVEVSDNCVGEDNLELFWEVDLYADGSRDNGNNIRGNGQNRRNVYPNGTHRITYYAVDGCGNESQCSYNFTIKDCKQPVSVCISGYSTSLMQNRSVTLRINEVISGSSYDNCSDYSDLRFSFSNNVNDITRTYNCNNRGRNDITIWTTDVAGNQSFCETYIMIQDNNMICPAMSPMANLSGLIHNEMGDMVEGVEVYSNYADLMSMTNYEGTFQLTEMPTQEDYQLTPQLDNDPKNGVSTLDLIKIRKHILGIELLDSPYKMIAADVNQSRDITTLDLIQIRRLILGLDNEFVHTNAWRFVRNDYQFSNPNNPFVDNFPERYDINNLIVDMENIDFIAIKMGDVNNSAVTNGLTNIDERTTLEDFILEVEDRWLDKNELATIEWKAPNLADIQGVQMTLAVAQDVEILTIENGVFNANHFNTTQLHQGNIAISWDKIAEVDNSNNILFKLKIRAKKDVKISNVLAINSKIAPAEAYNNLDALNNITIRYKNGTMVAKDNFVLQQNQPNPFGQQTTIGFYLPNESQVKLTIMDTTGKVLYQQQRFFSAGVQNMPINGADIPTTGLLYYQLESNEQVQTKKMIKLP